MKSPMSRLLIAVLFATTTGCATGTNNTDNSNPSGDETQAAADSAPSENGATSESAQKQKTEDEFSDFADSSEQNNQPAPETAAPPVEPQKTAEEPITAPPAEVTPAPVETAPIVAEPTPSEPAKMVEITGLKYKANETGGTVIIEASGPITYTTRSNPDLKQYVVEVPNSKLPEKLKRPLNTRDFNGAIGSIEAYQTSGSKTSRFVIQLRPGTQEPFIQVEGNTLLIVSSDASSPNFPATASSLKTDSSQPTADVPVTSADLAAPDADLNINLNDSRILTSQSLADFLSGNSKFYGKKISVEFNATDVRQAIRFFMEETGINMIIDKDVAGEVTMKLRQVPWDQAFITMLRMSDLIYQRQGSILRIATVKKLQAEEKDAKDLFEAKKLTQPLKVRNFFVNFVKISDASKSIKEMLKDSNGKDSQTTKIVEDPSNGKLIVQDTETNLDLIDKIIKNLDVPVKQVMIEAKIVEASDAFSKSIGIQWGLRGATTNLGNQQIQPNLTIGQPGSGSDMVFNLSYGTLPILGDLTSQLNLAELENTVKVISSPRIMTLTGNAATVNVTDSLVSKSKSVQAVNGGTAAPVDTFTSTPIPTNLSVTPNVTPDNFVSMKVGVNRSTGITSSDGTVAVNTRAVDTNILVRDGQTATIGGLYQTSETQGTTGVPGLKDIPFIGGLFRSKTSNKNKTELLIFLTPRVMNQDFQNASAKEGETL